MLAGLVLLVAGAACGPPARPAPAHATVERRPAHRPPPKVERRPTPPPPAEQPEGELERGKGTWYGKDWQGRPTASGEKFDRHQMTAAHKTLPMNTIVRVTNQKNGRSVTVRINDRGPYGKGRIIDVSEAAARKLGMIDDGVVPVTVEVIRMGPKKKKKKKR